VFRKVDLRSGAPERFADYVLGADVRSKDQTRNFSDLVSLLIRRAFTADSRRRANAPELRTGFGRFARPSNEQCNVRALAAAIRVQFIEYEEPQPGGGTHKGTFSWPSQDQFKHHVVGQQDVGR
jgi:hypothetical protein